MDRSIQFTPSERSLIQDTHFFRYIDFENPLFEKGELTEEGLRIFRLMKAIVAT